ncbi:MAG: rhomboid family intramembrane serine protease [Bacteroidetes bacterium]|nr:MAG: rhomboid family intramembrane serine protease [Bacteroidota bacterium]
MTLSIVIATTLFSVAALQRRDLMYRFDLAPSKIVHNKQYYRIFTHALLHADYIHLGINILVLYSFGRAVEAIFMQLEQEGLIFSASFYYVLLYVTGIAFSSLTSIFRYRNNPAYSSIGASGAVSAVVFTHIFFSPLDKVYFYGILPLPGILFGILYLLYSSYMERRQQDNINHSAHFWGAVTGFLFPLLLEPGLIKVFINQLRG